MITVPQPKALLRRAEKTEQELLEYKNFIHFKSKTNL